jgi:hypothetical protein
LNAANLDMEWNVEAPQSDRSVVDGNATVEGETHGSHSRTICIFLSYKFYGLRKKESHS